MNVHTFVLAIVLLMSTASASAQFGNVLKDLGIGDKDEVSGDKAASGLKEALQVGTEKAVNRTGTLDGYFGNEAIKILLPESVQKMDKGLRMAGFGPKIDEFILSMNRAAEKAAPFAKDIFWGAIKQMTFADAAEILKGGDTAATDYFEQETSDDLRKAFHPVVQEAMNEVGVTRQYKALVGQFDSIPFMKSEEIDKYVVKKALAGLFHVLGEEETNIRKNPAARVTDLLKEVFKD